MHHLGCAACARKATRLGHGLALDTLVADRAVPPGAHLHVRRRADAPQLAERHLADGDADSVMHAGHGHLDLDSLCRAVHRRRESASLLAPLDERAGVPLRSVDTWSMSQAGIRAATRRAAKGIKFCLVNSSPYSGGSAYHGRITTVER